MFCEPFVQERVVRPQQVERAPILADDAVDEELGLLAQGLPEVVVEIREDAHVGRNRIQIPQVQPLRGEVGDEVLGSRIRQHAAHLALEHRRLVELAPRREIEQLIVRNAAPQEEGEARRQVQIADAIRRAGRDAGGITLDAEGQEPAPRRPIHSRCKVHDLYVNVQIQVGRLC